MPELLWKAYIDFEVEEGERARARALYERLAASSGHWKVWVAYATFEAQPIQLPRDEREDDDEDEEDEENEPKMVEGDLELARQVFQKGYRDLKNKGLKNERVALLQVWKSFEEQNGSADDIAKVEGMMPVQGKRRYVDEETGQLVEDYDYILQTTSARRTRLHSSSSKWLTHGRPPGSPEVPAAVPAMLVMVAVAVAVHYQGSLLRVHRMIQTEIAGPNRTVRTSPWTRTWRVWRAHRATHNWLDS